MTALPFLLRVVTKPWMSGCNLCLSSTAVDPDSAESRPLPPNPSSGGTATLSSRSGSSETTCAGIGVRKADSNLSKVAVDADVGAVGELGEFEGGGAGVEGASVAVAVAMVIGDVGGPSGWCLLTVSFGVRYLRSWYLLLRWDVAVLAS